MSAPMDDEFLITLPSNVPGKAAAGNRPTRYETRLARPLRMDGAWEAALMNFTYPHEWTCLLRDYHFTIAYPAPGTPLVGSAGSDVSQEQPIDYLEWHEHLSEADLRLPEKSIALRQLHFNDGKKNWNFSDEVVFAADYPTPHAFCAGLEAIINRVLARVHSDPGVRVMLTATCPSRISIFSPRVKFVMLALSSESIIRAMGFQPAIYHSTRILSGESVDFLFYGTEHNDEMLAARPPAVRQIKDIYVYTDIVQPSLVSNSLANLLDIVPVTGRVGDISVHRPTHLHYVRLLGGDLSSIEIRLCKDDGEEVPIAAGEVLCQLQVRRVQLARS